MSTKSQGSAVEKPKRKKKMNGLFDTKSVVIVTPIPSYDFANNPEMLRAASKVLLDGLFEDARKLQAEGKLEAELERLKSIGAIA